MSPDNDIATSETVLCEMRQEFLDEVGDNARELTLLAGKARHDEATLESIIHTGQRLALSLRGQGETLGMSLLTTLGHRLSDYLSQARNVAQSLILDDLEQFLEVIQDVVEGRVALDVDQGVLVRRLPAKRGFSLEDIEVRDVEVMLVMEAGAQTRFVERELQQCGYRTVQIGTTFEALPLVVRTKPDMVIISAVMPGLSGIDLAIGIASMPETRNVPTALITSLDPDNEMLQLLPGQVPVIYKGPSFPDDLFRALDNLFLI